MTIIRHPRASARSLLAAAVLLAGCIEDSQTATPDDGQGGADGATAQGDGSTGAGGNGMQPGRDGAPPDGPGPDARVSFDAQPPVPDAATPPPPPPPPDNPRALCDAYFQRFDDCFAPQCPALAGDIDGLCRPGCQQDPASLRRYVGLSCEAFNEVIYLIAPQLEPVCEDAPAPPECEGICDVAVGCGFPGGAERCDLTCRTVAPPTRRCLAENTDDCMALFGCFQQGPGMGPDPMQICQGFCQRTAGCILNECAPGTLEDGYVRACTQDCLAEPLTPEQIQAFQAQQCPDIVADLVEADPRVAERCDNDAEAACDAICADIVQPCTDLDADTCRATCAAFDEANLRCVQFADSCGAVRACYGDAEGQDRCARTCDRLQSCLLEACPPRIIPPELDVNCTASCLADPPSEQETDDWLAASCLDIRRFAYQDNAQLAPLCEGGRDFRPSGDECAAFCDNGLQDCIGLGGRNFCLAACASLERDQYQCALEAQGACDAIDACLQ